LGNIKEGIWLPLSDSNGLIARQFSPSNYKIQEREIKVNLRIGWVKRIFYAVACLYGVACYNPIAFNLQLTVFS
jgi:hypothetical protein